MRCTFSPHSGITGRRMAATSLLAWMPTLSTPRALGIGLGELPGLLLGEIAVGRLCDLHGHAQRRGRLERPVQAWHRRELRLRLVDHGEGVLGQVAHRAAEFSGQELGASAGEVGGLVHEIRVDPRDEILQVEVEVVLGRRELGREVVAQIVGRQVVEVGATEDEGAPRLGHLLAVHREPTVDLDARGGGVPGGVEHGGPKQRVEVDDVLADDVDDLRLVAAGLPVGVEVLPIVCAPPLGRGDVADGRVEPHVEVLSRVPEGISKPKYGASREMSQSLRSSTQLST